MLVDNEETLNNTSKRLFGKEFGKLLSELAKKKDTRDVKKVLNPFASSGRQPTFVGPFVGGAQSRDMQVTMLRAEVSRRGLRREMTVQEVEAALTTADVEATEEGTRQLSGRMELSSPLLVKHPRAVLRPNRVLHIWTK